MLPAGFFLAIVIGFTLFCLVTDLRTRRIPNWLTVPVAVLGLLAHGLRSGLPGLQFSLLGFGAGFGVLLVLWLIGGGGGGDVKMMGALGAWLGAWLTVQVFITSALVTLLLIGGLICYTTSKQGFSAARRRWMAPAVRKENIARSRPKPTAGRRRMVPYAVPLALSTWIVLAFAWKTGTLLGVVF